MHQVMRLLHDFQAAMAQPIGDPTRPDCTQALRLRLRLIAEEFEELLRALEPKLTPNIVADVEAWLGAHELLTARGEATGPDVVEATDALVDMQYVITGAGVTWGLPLGPAFDEVHRANMAKAGGEVRADGKRLKPPGWTPPDIAGVIERSRLGVYALIAEHQRLKGLCFPSTETFVEIRRIEAQLAQLGYAIGYSRDGIQLPVELPVEAP